MYVSSKTIFLITIVFFWSAMKICKLGHDYVGKQCPICKKKWRETYREEQYRLARDYKQRNKKKIYEHYKKWVADNKSKVLGYRKTYVIKNPEKVKLATYEWSKKNKGKCNAYTSKYRAAKLNATPKWLTKFDLAYIKHIYIQAKELERLDGTTYEVDHIIPLQGKTVCGLHVPWNLQILTTIENTKKHNRLI
jgi:5-methylcytosine-specific restriction endonuclease McrA